MIVDSSDTKRKGHARGGSHDHDRAGARLGDLLHAQHIFQVDHRMAHRADRGDFRAPDFGDVQRFIIVVQDFDHRRARDGEVQPARTDDEPRNDRQRQRHAQHDAQPASDLVMQRDDAADPLDIGAHHVHPDPPAGNGGDLLRGR